MSSRATVIIPTYGNASFARWAIKSVQQQTIKDIEICIICDGSPAHMVALFNELAVEDPRIQVFVFPKSPRTGEPYRDLVIKKTSGRIIGYCSHDDLWLPDHLQIMEKKLKGKVCFTHTLHTIMKLPEALKDGGVNTIARIHWINLSPRIRAKMHRGKNYFGLTFGAHTRKSYFELPEGWVTTPNESLPTDLYMWCKFLNAFGSGCQTTLRITALAFPKPYRKDWSEAQRDIELEHYYYKIQDPDYIRSIGKQALKSIIFAKVKHLLGKSKFLFV